MSEIYGGDVKLYVYASGAFGAFGNEQDCSLSMTVNMLNRNNKSTKAMLRGYGKKDFPITATANRDYTNAYQQALLIAKVNEEAINVQLWVNGAAKYQLSVLVASFDESAADDDYAKVTVNLASNSDLTIL